MKAFLSRSDMYNMATYRVNSVRHLSLVVALRLRVLPWNMLLVSRLHVTGSTVLIQRTSTAGHVRLCSYSHQPQKQGSHKLREPLSVNLPYKSSWMSTSTGTGRMLLPSRSKTYKDVHLGLKYNINNDILERSVGLDPSTNIRSLRVNMPLTDGICHRAFHGTCTWSDRDTGTHQFQLLKPSVYTGTLYRNISLFGLPEGSAWSRAIADAEKIVGYPTSFMGLRYLLSDELSNIAMQVRKLVGTKHPLVKTARSIVYDGKHNIQTRGLIILLISKAAGPSEKNIKRQSMVRGIYPSQRTLAEIAEMIHTAFLVHKGVVNIRDILPSDGPRSIMEFGNKISVLSGDFLLASACMGLAELRNTHVVDLISQSISDLTKASFMAFPEENGAGNQLLPNLKVADWAKYVYLSSGSLIAKSCRAALELAGHGEEMQAHAFEFGKNIALAQQLHQELQWFTASNANSLQFSLTSAPVLLHLEGSGDNDRVRKQTKLDIKKLHQEIKSGSAIKKSQELCRTYAESARLAITGFPQSDARDALLNMVKAVS